MQSARPLFNTIARQAVRGQRNSSHGHGTVKFQEPSMNEMPLPNGSWQEHYNQKQKGYNAALALGIGFSTFSLICAKTFGIIYLNFDPPKSLD